MDQAQNLRNIIKAENAVPVLSRVITITSGKGGVGKSNLAINLAISLSRLGKKVVVLDADFGLANIEVMLGIRPQYNLSDLMFIRRLGHKRDDQSDQRSACQSLCKAF